MAHKSNINGDIVNKNINNSEIPCNTFCRLFAEAELTKEYRKEECKLCADINVNKADVLDSIVNGKSICITSSAHEENMHDEQLWRISIVGKKDELKKFHEWLKNC